MKTARQDGQLIKVFMTKVILFLSAKMRSEKAFPAWTRSIDLDSRLTFSKLLSHLNKNDLTHSVLLNVIRVMIAASFVAGCGVLEPTFKKYAEACSKTCEYSQTAFDANMSVLATDCSSCHSATTIKGKNLSSTDTAKNRTTILGFVKSGCNYTAELLTKKLTGGSHGGGIKNDPSLSQVQAWLSAEKACNQL